MKQTTERISEKKKGKKKEGGLLTARLFFFGRRFGTNGHHTFSRERERETLCALFILGHGDHRIRSREHSHLEAC